MRPATTGTIAEKAYLTERVRVVQVEPKDGRLGGRRGMEERSWTGGLGRFFREQSPKEMTLPHPQAGKNKHRKKEETDQGGVLGNLFERAIHIAEDGNAQEDVNPANNRTCGGITHHPILFP
jgi:hypothetical protein